MGWLLFVTEAASNVWLLNVPLWQVSFPGRCASLSWGSRPPSTAQRGHTVKSAFACPAHESSACPSLPCPWFLSLRLCLHSLVHSYCVAERVQSPENQAQRKTTVSKSFPNQWYYISLVLNGTLFYHISEIELQLTIKWYILFLVCKNNNPLKKVTTHLDGVLDSMSYSILSAPQMFIEPSGQHTCTGLNQGLKRHRSYPGLISSLAERNWSMFWDQEQEKGSQAKYPLRRTANSHKRSEDPKGVHVNPTGLCKFFLGKDTEWIRNYR